MSAGLLGSAGGPLAAPPWHFLPGGAAIGLFVLAFMMVDGHRLGVSSGFSDVCKASHDPAARRSWRLPFLLGIFSGGFLSAQLAGSFHPDFAVGLFDAATGLGLGAKALVFMLGGVFLGLGARLAGGCTSGHAIVGTALGNPASFKVAGLFFLAALITTRLVLTGLGA